MRFLLGPGGDDGLDSDSLCKIVLLSRAGARWNSD